MAARSAVESQIIGSDKLLIRNTEEFKLLLSLSYPQPSAAASHLAAGPGLPACVQPHLFNFNRAKEEACGSTVARIQASLNAHVQSRTARRLKKGQAADDAAAADRDQIAQSHPNYVRDICVLDSSGNVVDPTRLCADAFASGHTLCLNSAIRYPMVVDPGLVVSCRLTTQLLSGFPLHCELQLESCPSCAFHWEISPSLTRPEWRHFSDARCPTLPVDSAGCFVRLTVAPSEGLQFQQTFGPVTDATNSYLGTRHAFTAAVTPLDTVRVVTYNLLANLYADSDYSRDTLFPWCDPSHLAMSYRKCLIFRELAGYNADLVTLQEVDEPMFSSWGLAEFMREGGFDGECLMKRGKDGKPSQEGLALFYRRSRFELVEDRSLPSLADYLASSQDLAALHRAVKSNAKFAESWEPRGQCAQVLVLRRRDQPDQFVCLATTHLFWFPSANLVRLLQTHLLLHYLSGLKLEFAASAMCARFSVILTGDFNSQPDRGPYSLATRGRVSAEHADWFSPGREAMIPRSELTHSLRLAAAYEPQPFTNYTAGFSGHLDHIFYDLDGFSLLGNVPLPTLDQFTHLTALPNRCYPSDHLALIADLGVR